MGRITRIEAYDVTVRRFDGVAIVSCLQGMHEVLDSRYTDYRFTMADVVADNTSAGRFVVGRSIRRPARLDRAPLQGDHGGPLMPLIQVTLTRGRSAEQLQALGEALTAAVEGALGAPRESVRVVLTECEPEHWFVGGENLADLRASGRR